jgi:hypothetical protein
VCVKESKQVEIKMIKTKKKNLNTDIAFAKVKILRASRLVPFLFPIELRSNIGPKTSRIFNGPFVHLQVLLRRGNMSLTSEIIARKDKIVLFRSKCFS